MRLHAAATAILRLLAAAVAVGAALLAFHLLGPSPLRAADGALSRRLTTARSSLQSKGALANPQRPSLGEFWIASNEPLCPKSARAAPPPNQQIAPKLQAHCVHNPTEGQLLLVNASGATIQAQPLPTALSLIGPLAAVALVLLLHRPALGLLLAVLVGSVALHGPWAGLRHTMIHVLWPTLSNKNNLLIILFTLAMLGMVHVGIASGGFSDLARRVASGAARERRGAARRARMATLLLGIAIFFDDYANALIVGSSMRPLADRTGVSRAKLAFLVDATSAAVAGVALVSTWVGFEVGLLGEQAQHFAGAASSPYAIFLAILPYRFYCLFLIVLAFALAWSGRDFGPMRSHERRAALPPPERETATEDMGRARWWDAMAPVGAVLATVIALDLWWGRDATGGLMTRFMAGAEAQGMLVLAIAGTVGSILAITLVSLRRLLPFFTALRTWSVGVLKMLPIVVILIAAMSMRVVTEQSGAQDYLAASLGQAAGPWMPLITFITAGLVAFMTGSSWATMGILLPIVIPLAALAPGGEAAPFGWLLASAAAVLDGAIFGDHCSPISDTTVMSSAASGCPHDVHVLTQLPYALTGMLVAGGVGYATTAWLSWPPWTAYLPGTMILLGIVWGIGRQSQSRR